MTHSLYITFLKKLLIFSLIIVIIYIGLSYTLPAGFLSLALPFLFPFFIAATLISFHLIIKTLHNRFMKFVNRFMLITAIKLLLYAIVMVSYILLFPTDAIPFALNFLFLYLCFTTFETIFLVKYSKTISDQSNAKQP